MKGTITWITIALLLYTCKPEEKVAPTAPPLPTGSVEIFVKGTNKSILVSYYHPVLSKRIKQYTDKEGKIRIDGLVEAYGLYIIDVGDSCQNNSYCINYTKYINPKANQVLQQVQYVYQRRIIKIVTNTSAIGNLKLSENHSKMVDSNTVSTISDSTAKVMYNKRGPMLLRHDDQKWLYVIYLPLAEVSFDLYDLRKGTHFETPYYTIQENMCQDTLVYVLN